MNADIEDELRSHIQLRAEDLERLGLPRPEAERRARIEFGGHARYKEESLDAAGVVDRSRDTAPRGMTERTSLDEWHDRYAAARYT